MLEADDAKLESSVVAKLTWRLMPFLFLLYIVAYFDRINVGLIGAGGRGTYVAREFATIGAKDNSCQIVAVCDVYQKRVTQNKERHKCDGYLDYREVLARPDVDAEPKGCAGG